MSDDFGVDIEEVYKVIDGAEVLVVRFHLVQKRLLIDFRAREGVPPLIAVVPRAESVEDRFRSIKKMRPDLPFPEKVMSFNWPRSMPVMVTSGVWAHIVERMRGAGGEGSVTDCEQAMRQLEFEERMEVACAIRGSDHYQTLWERRRL